jgi:hypothetical protein
LDLAFALPLLATVGVLLARQRPLGDLLAPGVFSLAAAITMAVSFGELLRPAFGLSVSVAVIAPYLVPAVICFVLAAVAFTRVAPSIAHAPR